jgi:hypothetical protein
VIPLGDELERTWQQVYRAAGYFLLASIALNWALSLLAEVWVGISILSLLVIITSTSIRVMHYRRDRW